MRSALQCQTSWHHSTFDSSMIAKAIPNTRLPAFAAPKRGSRSRSRRVFYTSALISIRCCEESRRFYDRKRAEDKRHVQAVLALARRRVNVLWALLRDGRCYQLTPPVTEAA